MNTDNIMISTLSQNDVAHAELRKEQSRFLFCSYAFPSRFTQVQPRFKGSETRRIFWRGEGVHTPSSSKVRCIANANFHFQCVCAHVNMCANTSSNICFWGFRTRSFRILGFQTLILKTLESHSPAPPPKPGVLKMDMSVCKV